MIQTAPQSSRLSPFLNRLHWRFCSQCHLLRSFPIHLVISILLQLAHFLFLDRFFRIYPRNLNPPANPIPAFFENNHRNNCGYYQNYYLRVHFVSPQLLVSPPGTSAAGTTLASMAGFCTGICWATTGTACGFGRLIAARNSSNPSRCFVM